MILALQTQLVHSFVECLQILLFPLLYSRTEWIKFTNAQCKMIQEIQKCFSKTWSIYSWLNILIYWIHHSLGLKLLSRLTLGLSHLNEHRFKHNFENCINSLFTCSLEVESTKHFFSCTVIIQRSVFIS